MRPPGRAAASASGDNTRVGNRDQNRVGPPTFGPGLYLFYKLTTGRVERFNGAEGEAFGAALGHGIAGVELGAFEVGDHQELQADRAAAEDEDVFALLDAGFLDGFDDGVDGLDEGGFFEADVVGERDDAALGDPRHGFDVFAEAATVGREAGGEAGGFVLLALREEAIFAVEAGAAGRVMEAHHAIAGFEFCDAGADGDDGAGEFVAEDLGRFDVALEDFLDVGAADAAGGDFDEDFARADFGDGDFFDADDSLFAIDAGAHRFGDGAESRGGGGCGR